MIISHRHKFIFIHIPKCAGSTISYSLLNNLYFELPRKDDWIFKDLSPKTAEVFKEHSDQGNSFALNQHSRYNHVKKYLLKNNLNINEYFTFSFVKNPWNKCVSMYNYGLRMQKTTNADWTKKFKNLTFKNFLQHPHGNQIDWISDQLTEGLHNYKISVDFVGKSERLQQDYDIICNKIGIQKQKLPHRTEYYDEETKQIVAKKYAKDIKYFGYKFGE